MPSAKQQPSNIKHDVGIRPNVCKLTFDPPCIYNNTQIGGQTIRFMILCRKQYIYIYNIYNIYSSGILAASKYIAVVF